MAKRVLLLRRQVTAQPKCPNAWCRNILVWDAAERIWRCPSCRYQDRR